MPLSAGTVTSRKNNIQRIVMTNCRPGRVSSKRLEGKFSLQNIVPQSDIAATLRMFLEKFQRK